MVTPNSPSVAHLLDDLGGKRSSCSSSEATGVTSRATNRRTVSMISWRTSSLVIGFAS